MNNPTLNFDMISKILNIRMNSKRDDRYKNNFNKVIRDLNLLGEKTEWASCSSGEVVDLCRSEEILEEISLRKIMEREEGEEASWTSSLLDDRLYANHPSLLALS